MATPSSKPVQAARTRDPPALYLVARHASRSPHTAAVTNASQYAKVFRFVPAIKISTALVMTIMAIMMKPN